MTESDSLRLTHVLESHYDELKAFLIQKVGCPSIAEDILHETWLKAATRVSTSPVKYPRAFLYQIAKNLVVDWIRKEQTHSRNIAQNELSDTLAINEVSEDSRLIGRERLTALQRAIDELPPRCRQVFVLRKFELLKQNEIAAHLGISRNMVEKHLRKALHHCLKRVNELE